MITKREPVWNNVFYKALLVITYLGLNISLNMLNKWTLALFGFRYPILLSLAHMAFSFMALSPVMCIPSYRELHLPTFAKQWHGIIAIGTFFAINVGFNNVSLLSIPLSLNQVIRAAIPVAAAIGSVFIENKPPSRQEFISLLVLVSGVAISVYEGSNSKASMYGITLCILGTISNGLMMASIGKLLSEKMDVWRLTFYTAPITLVVLVPFYWKMEASSFETYQNAQSNAYIGFVMLGCVNALAYNLVHSLVIKVTSSVTTTVLGEMKIVLILMLSSIVLGESDMWTLKMLIGCTTAILGFCMYSHARLSASSEQWQPTIKGVPELAPSLSDSVRNPLIGQPSTKATPR